MDVSVKKTKGLERQIKVQVPAAQYQKAYDTRLQSLSRTVKIDGFRKGKVPLAVVKKRFGHDVEGEIVDDLINKSYRKAIVDNKLVPAGSPEIKVNAVEVGKDLEFTATFEVYPDITIAEFSKHTLEKPLCEIQQTDIDKMLETLRKQRADWITVDRKAKNDDQLLIDYAGTIDNVVFEGGTAQKQPVVLGSKRMIEGFEEQLIGAKAGEERDIKVTFPKDYQNKDLAGKKAKFHIVIHEIQEQKLPALDAEFIKLFGVEDGDLQKLQDKLREHMQKELVQGQKSLLKRNVMDMLLEAHKVELPKAMVDKEVDQLIRQTFEKMGVKNTDPAQIPRELFVEEASRRVSLGLILGEIIKEKQIKADPSKVRETIEEMAANYDDPAQVVKYYYSNQQMLQNVEAIVIEGNVVDWVVSQVKCTDKKMDFDTLMNENRANRKA